MKKTLISLLGAACVLAALASCSKAALNPIEIQTEEETTYSVVGGSSVDIPFVLTEVSGATLTSKVVYEYEDAEVTVKLGGECGVITVDMDDIFAPAQFNVELVIIDEGNNRESRKGFTIKAIANGRKFANGANTYVCAPGEIVLAPLAKGNSGESVAADSVVLTWQDSIIVEFMSLYKDTKSEVVVEFSDDQVGNAVISAYVGGKIAWNWTFWVVADEIKTVTVSTTDAQYSFMDRNLGATSSTVGNPGTIGNNYQWGRPNPLPGGNYNNSLRTLFGRSKEDTVKISVVPVSEVFNMETAIASPTTHYSGVSGGNYAWITTDYKQVDSATVVDLWGGAAKSKYDPCPDGYRVASEEAWKAVGAATTKTKVDASGTATTVNADVRAWLYTMDDGTVFTHFMTGETPHGGAYTSGVGSTWPCGKTWSRSFEPNYKVGATSSYFRARSTSQSPSSNSVSGGLGLGYAINVRCVVDK